MTLLSCSHAFREMPEEAEDRHEPIVRSVIAQHKTTARDTAVEVVFLAAEFGSGAG